MTEHLQNAHPGKILQKEFLEPLGLSQSELAQAIDVPSDLINELILGRRSVSVDTDLRLAHYFRLSDGYWLRLQNVHDVKEERLAEGMAPGDSRSALEKPRSVREKAVAKLLTVMTKPIA